MGIIKVIVEKELESFWLSEEDANFLLDEEIIELVKEDITAFIEGADWRVVRKESSCRLNITQV